MATFFILGGYGNTGRLLAKDLLAQTDAQLILAGRNFASARTFVDELNDPRVSIARVNACTPGFMVGHLAKPTRLFRDMQSIGMRFIIMGVT